MYVYLYDEKIKQIRKFSKELNKVENQLTEFGLQGGKIYLNKFNNPLKTINDHLESGARTFIIIGNDETINKAINYLSKINFQKNDKITVGIIPIGKKNNSIASAIGVKDSLSSCRLILNRRIKTLNLIQVNKSYFISQVFFKKFTGTIKTNLNYSIEIKEKSDIYIINFTPNKEIYNKLKIKPNNKKITLYINNKKIKRSNGQSCHFSSSYFSIENPRQKATIDSSIKIESPIEIKITDKQINLIIGKARNF
jgi:hypothetical protein